MNLCSEFIHIGVTGVPKQQVCKIVQSLSLVTRSFKVRTAEMVARGRTYCGGF